MACHLGHLTTGFNVSCCLFPLEKQRNVVMDREWDYLKIQSISADFFFATRKKICSVSRPFALGMSASESLLFTQNTNMSFILTHFARHNSIVLEKKSYTTSIGL